jgi:hypothetical protein
MRTIIIGVSLVLAFLSTAEAAPLYLKCDGTLFFHGERQGAIKIDGQNVTLDDSIYKIPIQSQAESDTLLFSDPSEQGTVDRITGAALIMWNGGVSFEGTCRKAERLF